MNRQMFTSGAPALVSADTPINGDDKEAGVTVNANGSEKDVGHEGLNPEFQRGIQKMQATTQVWSRNHLILAYIK